MRCKKQIFLVFALSISGIQNAQSQDKTFRCTVDLRGHEKQLTQYPISPADRLSEFLIPTNPNPQHPIVARTGFFARSWEQHISGDEVTLQDFEQQAGGDLGQSHYRYFRESRAHWGPDLRQAFEATWKYQQENFFFEFDPSAPGTCSFTYRKETFTTSTFEVLTHNADGTIQVTYPLRHPAPVLEVAPISLPCSCQ